MNLSAQDRDWLIRTVIGEAGGEPPEGQAAVASVVLNRARSGKFGGTSVRDVVLAPNQFEPWMTKRPQLLAIRRESPEYQRAAQIVDAVASGRVPDPTDGATHFLNVELVNKRRGKLPDWAMQMRGTAQRIGGHTFLGGGQKLAQADTGTQTDAGPSQAALERARALLGNKGPRATPSPASPTPAAIDGPTPQALAKARALLGLETPPPAELGKTVGQTALGFAQGVVDNVTDTVTLGAGDELQALTDAALRDRPGMGFGDRYSAALDEARGRRREFRQENPALSTTMDIVGGVGTAALAGPAAAAKLAPQLARFGLGPATTAAGRFGQAALGGATVGTVQGALSSEGGFLNRAAGATGGAGLGAGLGAGGAAAISLLQRILEPLARAGKAIVNGQLTNEAKAALASAGIDPNEAAGLLATHFAERSRRSGISVETARRAAADEFGVPLTRGQSRINFDDIAFEEAARSGSRGEAAGNVARTFEDQQRQAIRDAAGNLVPGGTTAAEAAGTVQGGLTAARETTKDWVRQGYEAIPRGTVIDVRAFDKLETQAGQALEAVTLNPSAHATAALAEIRKLRTRTKTVPARPTGETGMSVPGESTGDAAKIVGVDFLAVESLRKRLNAISRRVSTSDAQAGFEIDTVRKSLDDWIDQSVTNALISGDDAVLAAVKEARSRYGAFKRAFTPQGGGDDAGKAIEAMTDPRIRPDGLTPQEAARFLYGATKVGATGQSVRVARRIGGILGKDSAEWGALRQGAWQRVISPKEGQDIGAQALSSRILDFTKGDGASLAKELFKPEEISAMNRFANVLRMTVPPKRATNPSGTGAALARSVQDSFNAVTTMIGVANGNIGAAFGSRLLSGMIASGGGRGRALANFNPAGSVATRVGPRQAATFAGGLLGGNVAASPFSQ